MQKQRREVTKVSQINRSMMIKAKSREIQKQVKMFNEYNDRFRNRESREIDRFRNKRIEIRNGW